jgi:hypothetical protein
MLILTLSSSFRSAFGFSVDMATRQHNLQLTLTTVTYRQRITILELEDS